MAVHCNDQRAEAVDTESPQGLRIEVVEVYVLDRLDPGGLERGRAADDGEIGSTKILECIQRLRTQAALADHQAHAVLLQKRPRETLHAIAGSRADAQRRITDR